MHVTTSQRHLAAALFVVLAAVLVILLTTSVTLRYRSPAIAIKAWPWNGEARGSLAGRMILNGDLGSARKLAAQAVSEVPGDAVSLRAIGMAQPDAEMKGRAFRIMRLATRASRRDLQTNLWFIEYYVSQGDVTSAIRYYDYSLKSSADAERLLFPILVPAMTSPAIATAVRNKLMARPVWTTSFLQYAFAAGHADDRLIPIVLAMAHDRIGLPIDLKRQYAQRLADRGNLAGLNRLASRLGWPMIEGSAGLDKAGDLPPVDWRLLSGSGLSIFADPNAGFSFVASQNGTLAERILHLASGTYVLRRDTHFEAGGEDTRLVWSMACLPGSDPIAVLPSGKRASFVVPDGCAYQKMSLSLENERLADGVEISGTVKNMWIDRVR